MSSQSHSSRARLKIARSVRDELMRQLVLEKRYDLLARIDDSGGGTLKPAATRALSGFEFAVVTNETLEPVRRLADRTLVRADGLVFNVAVIEVVDSAKAFTDRIDLSWLVEIGADFCSPTGKVGGQRLPVTFQIFELFPDGIPRAYRERTRAFQRRGLRDPKVGVGVIALDTQSGKTWSNFPGLVRWAHVWRVKQALRDHDLDPDARKALLARTGFQLDKALLAVVVGAGVGAGVLWALRGAGVASGEAYGGTILFTSAVAAAISLKACRVVHASALQAGSAGSVTALVLMAVAIHLGLTLGLGSALTLAAAVFVSFTIGVADNPEGRS